MRDKRSGKNEFMPFDESDTATDFDEKHFQLSIHLSGGIFRSEYLSGSPSICPFFNCFQIYIDIGSFFLSIHFCLARI